MITSQSTTTTKMLSYLASSFMCESITKNFDFVLLPQLPSAEVVSNIFTSLLLAFLMSSLLSICIYELKMTFSIPSEVEFETRCSQNHCTNKASESLEASKLQTPKAKGWLSDHQKARRLAYRYPLYDDLIGTYSHNGAKYSNTSLLLKPPDTLDSSRLPLPKAKGWHGRLPILTDFYTSLTDHQKTRRRAYKCPVDSIRTYSLKDLAIEHKITQLFQTEIAKLRLDLSNHFTKVLQ